MTDTWTQPVCYTFVICLSTLFAQWIEKKSIFTFAVKSELRAYFSTFKTLNWKDYLLQDFLDGYATSHFYPSKMLLFCFTLCIEIPLQLHLNKFSTVLECYKINKILYVFMFPHDVFQSTISCWNGGMKFSCYFDSKCPLIQWKNSFYVFTVLFKTKVLYAVVILDCTVFL